jgi:hypothetical protein
MNRRTCCKAMILAAVALGLGDAAAQGSTAPRARPAYHVAGQLLPWFLKVE